MEQEINFPVAVQELPDLKQRINQKADFHTEQ